MAAANMPVGSGRHTFEVHEDWARPPADCEMMAASVTVDAQDRVYCFNRGKDHPVIVFDREGNYLSSWGKGLFQVMREPIGAVCARRVACLALR